MNYELEGLIKNAAIDPTNLDKEVEQNSGKAAYIAGQLSEFDGRYESSSIKVDAMEGKAFENAKEELIKEGTPKPTEKSILFRMAQNPKLIEGKEKLAELLVQKRKLRLLFDIYDKRFNMLQTRVASIRKEMDNLKVGI